MPWPLTGLSPNPPVTFTAWAPPTRPHLHVPQTLLPAASLLQLNGVRDACCKFLLSQLDPSNCLGIRGFADTHSCSDLLKAAHRYVLQHFVDVAKTEEFMLLPLKQVTCPQGPTHTLPLPTPAPSFTPCSLFPRPCSQLLTHAHPVTCRLGTPNPVPISWLYPGLCLGLFISSHP